MSININIVSVDNKKLLNKIWTADHQKGKEQFLDELEKFYNANANLFKSLGINGENITVRVTANESYTGTMKDKYFSDIKYHWNENQDQAGKLVITVNQLFFRDATWFPRWDSVKRDSKLKEIFDNVKKEALQRRIGAGGSTGIVAELGSQQVKIPYSDMRLTNSEECLKFFEILKELKGKFFAESKISLKFIDGVEKIEKGSKVYPLDENLKLTKDTDGVIQLGISRELLHQMGVIQLSEKNVPSSTPPTGLLDNFREAVLRSANSLVTQPAAAGSASAKPDSATQSPKESKPAAPSESKKQPQSETPVPAGPTPAATERPQVTQNQTALAKYLELRRAAIDGVTADVSKINEVVSDGKITQDELTKLKINWVKADELIDGGMDIDGTKNQEISEAEAQKFIEVVEKWAQLKFHQLYQTDKNRAVIAAAKEYFTASDFEMRDVDSALAAAQNLANRIIRMPDISQLSLIQLFRKKGTDDNYFFKAMHREKLTSHAKEIFKIRPEDLLGDKAAAVVTDISYYHEYLEVLSGNYQKSQTAAEETNKDNTSTPTEAAEPSPAGLETAPGGQSIFKIGTKVVTEAEFNQSLKMVGEMTNQKTGKKNRGVLTPEGLKEIALAFQIQRAVTMEIAKDKITDEEAKTEIRKFCKDNNYQSNVADSMVKDQKEIENFKIKIFSEKLRKGQFKEEDFSNDYDRIIKLLSFENNLLGNELKAIYDKSEEKIKKARADLENYETGQTGALGSQTQQTRIGFTKDEIQTEVEGEIISADGTKSRAKLKIPSNANVSIIKEEGDNFIVDYAGSRTNNYPAVKGAKVPKTKIEETTK